jgi:hypothetical protein
MSKFMAEGLAGVGKLVETRMIERGIPRKFISANLHHRDRKGMYVWKNGDEISEVQLDKIYRELQYGPEIGTEYAALFEAISKFRKR